MAALERSAAAGRDRFKFSLSEALSDRDDAHDIMSVATRLIGTHLGVSQVGFGIVDSCGEYATVGKEWNDGRMPKFVGRWRLDDFGPDRVAMLKAGRTLVIDDIHVEDPGEGVMAAASYELAIRSVLSVPLVRNGALVAILFVHHPDARVWHGDEIELVEDIAARLWSAVMRARADERLVQSEARARARADELDAIYDAAPVGLAVLDRDLHYVNINERLAEINGISVADHIGRTVLEIVPDVHAQVVETFDRVLAGQGVIGVEITGETAAQPGVVRTWRSNWLPMRDEAGSVVGVTLSAEEITAEKAAVDALKVSQARVVRELARADIAQQAARAAFYEFDPQTGIGMPSPNLTEITGYAHQPTITVQWWQSIVHPSDLAGFSAALESATLQNPEYSVDYRIRHKDGHWLWVADCGRAVATDQSGQYCNIGMVLSIDEQRQNEQALAESEVRYRAIFEQAGIGVARISLDGRFIQVNDRYCTVLGRQREELVGAHWQDITHPDDVAGDLAKREQALAGDADNFVFEKQYVGKDGSEIWVNLTISLVRDPADVPIFFVAMVEDIGTRKVAEAALSTSEAQFRTLAEALPAMIFVADADGKNIYSNQQFHAYSGMDGDALLGDGWIEALHPDDRERAAQTWAKSWRDGHPYETSYRFRSAMGEYRTFLVRGSPLRDKQGNIVQWFGQCSDIEDDVALRNDLAAAREALIVANADLETQVATRTKELVRTNRTLQSEIKRRELAQAALIQGQKLEALGQLTAGVAHDFNNILAAIAGGMGLIERRIDDEKIKVITGHCKDAAFRGATLVKQMLAFSRQEVLAPRSVNLARLADEIAPLIRQAIPGNIVSIDFPAALPPVLIDPVLLETALLNLAVNARDAMPGGGTLSLTASLSRPGDRHHPAEFKAAEAVAIKVRDSGEGMPPEIVQRVTEPFFTTKAPGSGTGLGLAMVHGFIGQSHGAMHIDSRVGAGTTITLYLPVSTAVGDAEPVATVVTTTSAPTGVGAVLLVDDDPAVRAVAAEQLRELGYTITEADGFVSAMSRIDQGEHYDCVVSDVVMPGGDGIALAAAIRAIQPGLPILFMTGRADGKRVAGEQVLHKPFKLVELATAVADIIGLSARESATVARIASRSSTNCVAQMLDHWNDGKFVGKVPAFTAFDADVCSEPHKLAVVIADPSQLPMRFQVVSAGKDLEDLLGRRMSDSEFDVSGAEGFGSIEESYRRAVKTRLPVFDTMKMDFGDGAPERFERLILPYSSEGGIVDRLVAVVVFGEYTQSEGQNYVATAKL